MRTWTVYSSTQTCARCPARLGPHTDPLHRRDDREQAAGCDDGVKLDSTGGRQEYQPAVGPVGFRRRDRFARVRIPRGVRLPCEHQGFGLGVRSKQARGARHVQGLVWPGVVVGVHPGTDRGLRRGQVYERFGAIEELAAQGPMPALDLAGRGRRVRLGEPGGDPVFTADPLEQHLRGSGFGEPAGELFTIVGQRF
jgi:hypothetical protein